jgi:hypothetical protein
MIGYTSNGEPIIFSQVLPGLYLVFHGDRVYFTYERPVTDQEIKQLEENLFNTRSEIQYLRNLLNSPD